MRFGRNRRRHKSREENEKEHIMSVNLGIALEDVATAILVYERQKTSVLNCPYKRLAGLFLVCYDETGCYTCEIAEGEGFNYFL